LADTIKSYRAEGIDADLASQRLYDRGYPYSPTIAQRLLDRADDPDLSVTGDQTLGEKQTAIYPRDDLPIECIRYELPWWAMSAVRAMGLVERGLVRIDHLDAWHMSAVSEASAVKAEIERERRDRDGR